MGYYPSLPKILDRWYKILRALYKSMMVDGNSLSVTVSRRTRHLKDVTISSVCIYAQNAKSAPAHASSYARHCCFLLVPHRQSAFLG